MPPATRFGNERLRAQKGAKNGAELEFYSIAVYIPYFTVSDAAAASLRRFFDGVQTRTLRGDILEVLHEFLRYDILMKTLGGALTLELLIRLVIAGFCGTIIGHNAPHNTQDIENWKSAIRAFENIVNPDRTKLYIRGKNKSNAGYDPQNPYFDASRTSLNQ